MRSALASQGALISRQHGRVVQIVVMWWLIRSSTMRPQTLRDSLQVNPYIRKEKWSADEDKLLASLVAEHGNRWADIAKQCVPIPVMIHS